MGHSRGLGGGNRDGLLESMLPIVNSKNLLCVPNPNANHVSFDLWFVGLSRAITSFEYLDLVTINFLEHLLCLFRVLPAKWILQKTWAFQC